jgi:glycosyltransferase involved in cell wall biosynthesis
MTRVAVIVPCFNDGETIVATLSSLEDQEPHELVVVDDGSRDPRTRDVLSDLEAAGVQVVRRENGGLSAARMTGLAATSAPYVFPLDADDLLGPRALDQLADALDADPAAMAAWGDVELFGSVELRLSMPKSLDPWLFTFVNEVPGTSLLRRTALEATGGWRLEEGYEDWDLWLSFAERGFRGVYVPLTMLRYRQHAGRMNAEAIARHDVKHARLRDLHPSLFADRNRLRRESQEPWYVKALWPLIEGLPFVSLWNRHRLCRIVRDPRRQLASRRPRDR